MTKFVPMAVAPMLTGLAACTQGDVIQSNGVIHVVDTVLMPN